MLVEYIDFQLALILCSAYPLFVLVYAMVAHVCIYVAINSVYQKTMMLSMTEHA